MKAGQLLLWQRPSPGRGPLPRAVVVSLAHEETRAGHVGVRVPESVMRRFGYPCPLVVWVPAQELRMAR